MSAARLLVTVSLAAAAAGCGAPETPKAPKTAVADTVGKLGLFCGEATRVLAGDNDKATLRKLDSRAQPPAQRLIAIAKHQPKAVYLGSDMTALVATEASALSSCQLTSTAKRLKAEYRKLS